jgi:hypothetical protein
MSNISHEEILSWIGTAKQRNIFSSKGFSTDDLTGHEDMLYPHSLRTIGNDTVLAVKLSSDDMILVVGKTSQGFKGIRVDDKDLKIFACPLDHANAVNLRKKFKYTSPSPLSSSDITIGLGDRLGIASEGHLRLLKGLNVNPVLAQQSVRELTLTERTYEEVLDSASFAVFKEGYDKPWGADGDHLKTVDWVKGALKTGFTMITADVSDHMHNEFSGMDETRLIAYYEKLGNNYINDIEKRYLGCPLELDTRDMISFSKKDLMECSLIYKDAIDHAVKLYKSGFKVKKDFDFELSIDETVTPTSYQAHVFVAKETALRGIKIASLAPRFIGEFQKGIDYKGDVAEFEKTFAVHASISRCLGHKISVHSGSDKFAIFPIVSRHAKRYHLKTAGTNWLQALEVISEKDPVLFKKIYAEAVDTYPKAKQYYHITPDMNNVPQIGSIADNGLPLLFQNNDVRQVLHIAYGELFKSAEIKERIYTTLKDNIDEYHLSLNRHIGKHFNLLGIKEKFL